MKKWISCVCIVVVGAVIATSVSAGIDSELERQSADFLRDDFLEAGGRRQSRSAVVVGGMRAGRLFATRRQLVSELKQIRARRIALPLGFEFQTRQTLKEQEVSLWLQINEIHKMIKTEQAKFANSGVHI